LTFPSVNHTVSLPLHFVGGDAAASSRGETGKRLMCASREETADLFTSMISTFWRRNLARTFEYREV
jgi:hypothetical protein